MKVIIYVVIIEFCINNVKDIFNNFIKNISYHEDILSKYNFSQTIFKIENITKNIEYNCLNITSSFTDTVEIISKAIDARHDIAYQKIYKGIDADFDIDIIKMIDLQRSLLEKILYAYYDIKYHQEYYNSSNSVRKLSFIDDIKDGFQEIVRTILGEDIYNFLVNVVEYVDNFLNQTILNFTDIKATLQSYSYNFSENCLYLNDTVVNITEVFQDVSSSLFGTTKLVIIIIVIIISLIIIGGIVSFAYKINFIFCKKKKYDDKIILLNNLNN